MARASCTTRAGIWRPGRRSQDIADTPLLIKRPFQHTGRISDRHVRTMDILPTIADVLGIRMPWRVDGVSIFDRAAHIPSNVVVYQRSGGRLTLSLREFKRRIRASLKRKIRLLRIERTAARPVRHRPPP